LSLPYGFMLWKYIRMYIYSDIIWCWGYNYTGIYIVKYRQSTAFGHLLGSPGGVKWQKTSECCTSRRCRRSEHHAVFIGCQHQRCPHYCFGQGTGAVLSLKTCPYCLQRVQFVASWLTIFAALLRTIDRSNAKLGEGIKHIFYGLLAVFRTGKVSSEYA